MFNFLKRKRKLQILPQVTRGSLESIYRPYYLNNEKINNFFEQEYAPLEKFTTTAGINYGAELSGGIRTPSLPSLLGELATELKASLGKSTSGEKEYSIPTAMRFIYLFTYWDHNGYINQLAPDNFNTLKRHDLISWKGAYRFAENIDELIFTVTDVQAWEIMKRKKFDELL